jgi:signal transduction histidine kinase
MTRILVIDDEVKLSEEVLDWLNLEGYDTASAADGIAGINEAFRQKPDLIVCDITMPRLDGHGVLLEIRSNPATADIPFIFVTARASHQDMRTGMDMGADDYITKPFTRRELLDAIQSRLGKKAVLEQKRQQELDGLQEALMQEQEQRMLKARMVAMFSHDFRNPLAGIQSTASLLQNYYDRIDVERRNEHFNRIQVSVQQLLQMLDDMLTVAHMESGKLAFTPQPVELEPFFQAIVDEFRAIQGSSRKIAFESEGAAIVMADRRLLRQIAANLISNAIKYSPAGSPVWVQLASGQNQFSLSVTDQGMGIPEPDQVRLFEAFQRASNVGQIQGTGLGLAIVKQAAELHGGLIQFESHVGKGTHFLVTIPCDSVR